MSQKKNVDVLTRSVLDVLTERKQTGLIPEVSAALRKIDSDKKDQNRGTVYSPVELGKIRLQRVKKIVELLVERNIELTNALDKTILGGFKVVVGDWVLDASLKSDFERLLKTLIGKE